MTTSKLVSNFRRSLSFPNKQPSPKPPKSLHVRSASLPCTSHPLISLIRSHIFSLSSSWTSQPRTSSWAVDGLTRLRTIHDILDDILQTHDSLRQVPLFVDKVLEAFLKLVDVFGTFQTLILLLKHKNSAAQMAIRRKDNSKTATFLKDLKNIGKEMEQLLVSIRLVKKCDEVVHVDLGDVVGGIVEVTMLVSISVFNAVSMPLTRNTTTCLTGLRLLNKGMRESDEGGIEEIEEMRREWLNRDIEGVMVLKRMAEMERCVGEIEVCSERVFRGLINTRVSLLNVLTNE